MAQAIKVLLVDDEVVIKKVLMEKFDWAKFDMEIVGAVNSAQEAIEFIDCFDVDLVITDMKMPNMDGNRFIEEALKLNKSLRCIVLSAYTDFKMVRQSFKLGVFDYLQKSDINTPVMNDILMKLHNEIINEKRKKIQTKSTLINIDNPTIHAKGRYNVIHIKWDTEIIPVNDMYSLKIMNNTHVNCYIIQYYSNNIVFLLEHKQNSSQQNYNEINEFVENIFHTFNIESNFLVGISKIGSGNAIGYLKTEAEQAITYSYYTSGEQKSFYYTFENQNNGHDDKLSFQYWKERIKKSIKHIDIDDSTDIMYEMLSYIGVIKPDVEKCKELIFEVYFYYINSIGNASIINIEEIIESNHKVIQRVIQHFNKYAKLNQWIKSNLDSIKQKYFLEYKSNIIEIIKAYISLNLSDDLSLCRISELYGVNSSYISYLFKKMEGISLRKYISNARMDKAQYYLENSNIKVKDICALTGYNSVEHFSRAFKNEYGQSPNQYRRERLNHLADVSN